MTPQEQRSTTEVERIRDQFRRAFDGEAWHGPSVLAVARRSDCATSCRTPDSRRALDLGFDAAHRCVGTRLQATTRRRPGPTHAMQKTGGRSTIRAKQPGKTRSKHLIDNHRELLDAIANVDESRLNEPIIVRCEHAVFECLRDASWWRAARSVSRGTNSNVEESVGELMSGLSAKECVPCRGGVPPLTGRRDRETAPGVGWVGSCERASSEEELSIFELSRSADVCESRWRSRGRAGTSSGYLFWVGTGGDLDLDAQDRWADGE